jgi:hypothetical protein
VTSSPRATSRDDQASRASAARAKAGARVEGREKEAGALEFEKHRLRAGATQHGVAQRSAQPAQKRSAEEELLDRRGLQSDDIVGEVLGELARAVVLDVLQRGAYLGARESEAKQLETRRPALGSLVDCADFAGSDA